MYITQSVIYKPYQNNPNAADEIVRIARKHLQNIAGTETRVGKAVHSDRTVGISNGTVVKTTTWAGEAEKAFYFAHPNLQQYVLEVLHGWRLEGDPDVPASADAFIAHILGGKDPRKWERNVCFPDSEVLWGGEKIVLYEWE